MSGNEDTMNEPMLIDLEDMFDITVAEKFRTTLLEALNHSKSVELKAEKIERADTSALQVLCAFFKDAKAKGIEVCWVNPTHALIESADLLGLKSALELHD